MKKLFLLLILIGPLYVLAQTDNKPANPPVTRPTSNEPLYIVDGKEADKSTALKIGEKDVAEIQVLKDAQAAASYGAKGANGVVVVTTRKFAIAAYQEKFSTFSDDLESYYTGHSTDDSQFIYVIDGVPVPKDRDEVNKLFHLNKEMIDTVKFTQNEPEGSKILARVIITTKK